MAFYQVFNPEKLQQPAELTKLAARFLADQKPLNTALHKKYGCDLNSDNMFHTAVHSAMELLEQGVVTKSEYQKLGQQAAALSKRNLRTAVVAAVVPAGAAALAVRRLPSPSSSAPRPVVTGTLYATMACPFAHRAMLALALRPVPELALQTSVPTTNQLTWISNLGIKEGDHLSSFATEVRNSGTTPEQLAERKAHYNKTVVASGETPALKLASGETVEESEIISEFIDSVSTDATNPPLIPACPLQASRVRRSMKSFNALPPKIIGLLKVSFSICVCCDRCHVATLRLSYSCFHGARRTRTLPRTRTWPWPWTVPWWRSPPHSMAAGTTY